MSIFLDGPSLETGVLIDAACWRCWQRGAWWPDGPRGDRRVQAHNQAFARRVEEVLAAQQQLLADTSHELRTPLTTVRGNHRLVGPRPARPASGRRCWSSPAKKWTV